MSVRFVQALVALIGLAGLAPSALAQRASAPADTVYTDGFSFRPIPRDESFLKAELVAYACVVSSPNVGASQGERYQYARYYLTVPDEVMDAAEGRQRVIRVRVGSRTLHAAAARAAPVLVREARCIVPDDERAVTYVLHQALRFQPGSGRSWEGEPMRPVAGSLRSGKGGTYPPDLDQRRPCDRVWFSDRAQPCAGRVLVPGQRGCPVVYEAVWDCPGPGDGG